MSVRAILATLPYKIKSDNEERLWNEYVAKSLQYLTNNMANAFGGTILLASYDELIKPQRVDHRSAEEIIEDIKKKMNS